MVKRSLLISLLVMFMAPALVFAQSDRDKKKARKHFEQAEAYMKAKVHDLAIKEYKAGYKLMPKAHGFLFNIGLAYEEMGEKEKALDAFENYLKLEPEGKKAVEARARSVALKRALESEANAEIKDPPDPDDGTEDPPDDKLGDGSGDDELTDDKLDDKSRDDLFRDDLTPAPGKKKGPSWGLVALGVGLVAAGVAADLLPSSGENGQVDAMDFVPVGLYGLGGLLVWQGAF